MRDTTMTARSNLRAAVGEEVLMHDSRKVGLGVMKASFRSCGVENIGKYHEEWLFSRPPGRSLTHVPSLTLSSIWRRSRLNSRHA